MQSEHEVIWVDEDSGVIDLVSEEEEEEEAETTEEAETEEEAETTEEEEAFCYFCGDRCNLSAQACGPCMRSSVCFE
jgi:hypothetical protein